VIKTRRLGKLQRWILREAYLNMVKKGHNNPNDATVTKKEIYEGYYHLRCHLGKSGDKRVFFSSPQSQRIKVVALSNSLSRLFKMGLIRPETFYKNKFVEAMFKGEIIRSLKPGRFYIVGLEDEGIEIARELLAL